MSVDDSGDRTFVTKVDLELPEVLAFFEQYEELEDESEKGELAHKICMALTVHTIIEEEIFYPVARKVCGCAALLTPLAWRARRKARCNVVRHIGSVAVVAPCPPWPLAGKSSRGWRCVFQSSRRSCKVRSGSGT